MLIVSAYANNLTNVNSGCLTAFGTCRKYQDAAGAAITTCSQSQDQLASKLKSLLTNQNLVNQAQSTIGQLAKRTAVKQQLVASASCGQVVAWMSDLVESLQVRI